MKALEILKDIQDSKWCGVKPTLVNWNLEDFNEAIEELENLQNENKSLVKTLEKYNEEMIELRKCNQELLNTVIEAQKVIKNVLEGMK